MLKHCWPWIVLKQYLVLVKRLPRVLFKVTHIVKCFTIMGLMVSWAIVRAVHMSPPMNTGAYYLNLNEL